MKNKKKANIVNITTVNLAPYNFYKFITEKIILSEIPESFPKENKLKKTLSKKEQNLVKYFEELSDEAQNVTKKIFEFIEDNNPNM